MQPFHLLLLFLFSVTSTSATSSSSDLWLRDPDVTRFTVHPKDSTRISEVAELESQLKSLCGDANVSRRPGYDDQHSSTFHTWTVISPAGQDLTSLMNDNDVQGARLVEVQHSKESIDNGLGKSEKTRRDVGIWKALAKNATDVKKTEEFLKSKVEPGSEIEQFTYRGEVFGWFNLTLSQEAKDAVQDYEGIKAMRIGGGKMQDFGALPVSTFLRQNKVSPDSSYNTGKLSRRSITWVKQFDADKALVEDSKYSGGNVNPHIFVYPDAPGRDTFVYVVDRGVQFRVQNPEREQEFRVDDVHVLQTRLSVKARQNPEHDDSTQGFHGTAIASKAVGEQYGLAKSATLVPVKMTYDEDDFANAFEMIWQDLQDHPERKHKSVVLISTGSVDGHTYASVAADEVIQDEFGRPVRDLLQLGVPIVCAAGNAAGDQRRTNVDSLPAVLQDDSTPLIIVGNADNDGKRYYESQVSNAPMIFAPGVKVEVQSSRQWNYEEVTGTSVAAPQVAGLIATYVAYPQTPWDDSLQGLQRVKAISDYLLSDGSSWERSPGIRMMWNGANEDDHKHAGDPSTNTLTPASPLPSAAPPTHLLYIVLQGRLIPQRGESYQNMPTDNEWLYFLVKAGDYNLCADVSGASVIRTGGSRAMLDNPPWPGGTWSFKPDVGQDCEYKNNGQNAGAIWCAGRNNPIQCQADDKKADKDPTTCVPGEYAIIRHAVVLCEW